MAAATAALGERRAEDPGAADGRLTPAPHASSETRDEGVRVLAPGDTRTGAIDFAGDTDRVRLDLQPGTYLLSLRGSGENPLLDPYLASNISAIADDDDGGTGTNALITFRVTTAGTYTFDLGAYPDSGLTGEYTVHLEQMGADTIPAWHPTTVAANLDAPTFGFLQNQGDGDVYRVHLEAGTYYNLELAGGTDYQTNPDAPPAGELDVVFDVYFEDGFHVLGSSNLAPGELAAGGGFIAETTGDYYVHVGRDLYSNVGPGGYELDIETIDLDEVRPTDSIDWGGPANVAEDGPLNDGVFYVYFAAAGEVFDGATSLGWTSYERQRAMAAFDTYSQFADVTFAATANRSQATFTLVTVESDEFLGVFNPPGTPNAGIGQFAIDGFGWDRTGMTGGLEQGGYGFSTLVHEFGHALGLAHPHDNGGGSEVMLGLLGENDEYGLFDLDQAVHTVMSYNDGWAARHQPLELVDYGYTGTPMALDIAVIQAKYGAVERNAGNTVYVLPDVNDGGSFYQSIWDTGGVDLIRYDGSRYATIDLTAATLDYSATGGGVMSAAEGLWGGFTIAAGVWIENAVGGHGSDTLIGNAAGNLLMGRDGHDDLFGLAGDDQLNGGEGSDTLEGGEGNDTLKGGGVGTDMLRGGEGNDRLSDSGSYGSLIGGAGDDVLDARGSGPTTMVGGEGDDRYYVDDAEDRVFESAGEGVDIVYASLSAYDLVADDIHVEYLTLAAGGVSVSGNALANTLTGNAAANSLSGEGGDDTVRGGAGGDTMNGGAGVDTLDYSTARGGAGVVASLAAGSASGGEAQGDTFAGFENLTGSIYADTLVGDAAGNLLDGGNGNDRLEGGMGSDTMAGGGHNDALFGDSGADRLAGSTGGDKLTGGIGRDRLTGDTGADQFIFADRDTAATRSGADLVVDFSHAEADRIHLRAIDANAGRDGNQNFAFIGAGAFTGMAGQVHYVHAGGDTFVEGDTTGDGVADFVIRLVGTIDLTGADFVL